MTKKIWNELKAGEFVMYTGKDASKKDIVCVLTGDDIVDGDYKGMCVLGSESVWDTNAPWRRVFRDNKCSNWTKVKCIMLK